VVSDPVPSSPSTTPSGPTWAMASALSSAMALSWFDETPALFL
jgi:hypothetical protein